MGYTQSKEELRKSIISASPLTFIQTEEEKPVLENLIEIAKDMKEPHYVFSWTRGGGLFCEYGDVSFQEVRDPMKVLGVIKQYDHHAFFLLHDFHIWLDDNKDYMLHLKDTAQALYHPTDGKGTYDRYEKKANKYMFITSPVRRIPTELGKLSSFVSFSLPNREDIEEIVDGFLKTTKTTIESSQKQRVINASLGLSETEILASYRKCAALYGGKIDPAVIVKEKKSIIEKDGFLKYFESNVSIDDVGGLNGLINWIQKRKVTFNDALKEQYQLNNPKGILLTGVQGCGKSQSAKMIANFLDMPLVGLDIGSLMSKWIGESEDNLAKALKLAETISPCVLWMDEFDKAIPSLTNNQTHEVTKRMMSTLLTWLQEKKEKIFVVATANNIHHLPPEIMRKGRFDEIFFIDLPKEKEREQIFSIHLKKKGLDESLFNLQALSKETDGFSGAEIESVVNEACVLAACESQMVMQHHLLQEIEVTNPISETMEQDVAAIRLWAIAHNVRKAN